MRLEPLYRIRFTYPESWAVGLAGGWQQMFFIAEGPCEGSITGRFRSVNFPRKEGAAGPFRPRRQIVGSVFHVADREPYRRLNDAVCVGPPVAAVLAGGRSRGAEVPGAGVAGAAESAAVRAAGGEQRRGPLAHGFGGDRRRKGEAKGFTWADYRDLILATHRALSAPLVWVWDNLNIHLAPELAGFAQENEAWLRIYRLPAAHGLPIVMEQERTLSAVAESA